MNKSFDVVALGELLIDFTEAGLSEQGNPLWEANPGGAPCNVLAMLQKLGRKTAFLGKVGKDVYGGQLRKVVSEAGVDLRGLLEDPEVHTTLAVVHKLPNGDRDFSFYRNPGADMMLREDELDPALLADCRIFHFGTLSMTHPGVRAATKAAVAAAKVAGALISFDPNLRPPLWDTLELAKEQIEWGLGQCDVLKISDNEVEFLLPELYACSGAQCAPSGAAPDYAAGARALLAKYPNIKLLNVTCGPDGAYSFCCGHQVFVPSFKLGGTIETTGAGDTFCASVLHNVLTKGVEDRSEESLRDMLRFANAAAYLVTTKKGAIRSMPDPADVEAILAAN
ncbi:MAG: carbohydrate kinase [Oscillospiraceae bacterium]|nr:carbohydrate kinase [Oscillospiraceae bacterium]